MTCHSFSDVANRLIEKKKDENYNGGLETSISFTLNSKTLNLAQLILKVNSTTH